MADTAAALVIQLSAETRQFQREMRAATGVFDAEGRKIERRQAQLRKNLENNFSGFGKQLGGVLSAAAVIQFGRNIINIGDALSDASQQLGVTTQQLQGLDYAARVSGASSEKLTQALGFLSDGLGDAQKGEGDLAKYMRANHVQMGDTIDVLYDLADRTKAATTYQEKMNIATAAFGAKAGKSMVSFLNQGAEGLRRLQQEASAKGQIWDEGTVGRLDQAKDALETLEKAIVNIAAVPASEFISDMSDLLTQLSEGNFEGALEKLGHVLLPLAGATAGGIFGGLPGAVAGGIAGVAADHLLLPHEKAAVTAGDTITPPKQKRSGVPLSAADQAKALRDAQRINELLRSSGEDAKKSSDDATESLRDVVREQDQGLLARAQDWSNFADIQKEVIQELAKLDIQSVNDRRDADVRALEVRRQADQDHLTELKASTDEKKKLDADYAEQRLNIEQFASNQVKVIRQKEADDIATIQTKNIQVSDRLRQGLLDMGTAALHGFGSLKDAAASALDQIAELILQMYVLKPLIENIFGPSGTDIVGSLLSSIPGFAGGTNSAPGGLALVGERGPELVNLPRGSQVIPNISGITRSSNGPVIVQNFDLSGAVLTDDLMKRIDQRANMSAQQHIAQYDRSVLPQRVATLNNDPRRRY